MKGRPTVVCASEVDVGLWHHLQAVWHGYGRVVVCVGEAVADVAIDRHHRKARRLAHLGCPRESAEASLLRGRPRHLLLTVSLASLVTFLCVADRNPLLRRARIDALPPCHGCHVRRLLDVASCSRV